MSADDLFQLGIRTAAAVSWLVVLWRFRRLQLDARACPIALASLTLLLGVIAAGGWASGLHLVPGEWIRVTCTATTVVLLIVAVAVLL